MQQQYWDELSRTIAIHVEFLYDVAWKNPVKIGYRFTELFET